MPPASALAAAHAGRLILVEGRFGDMLRLVEEQGIAAVDGVVLDIGVSSMQIDEAARGFSFLRDGPLDMRMSQSGATAADIVNTLPPEALSNIIYTFGEEPRSRAIARAIVASRSEAPITTTAALVRAVEKAVGRQRPQDRIHPATRTFQALRIHVNGELEELVDALHAAERLLVPGGRLVVVTFHSLEDRIVKRFFVDACRQAAFGLAPHAGFQNGACAQLRTCPSRATSAPRTARSPAIRARAPPSCAPASAPQRRPCPRSRPRSRFAATLPDATLMHKFLNAILVLVALVSGFVLYSLEHTTRGLERELARLEREIAREQESIKLLNAEWSSLTRPDRLQGARRHSTSACSRWRQARS